MIEISPELQSLKDGLLELSSVASQSGLPLESMVATRQTKALNRLASVAELQLASNASEKKLTLSDEELSALGNVVMYLDDERQDCEESGHPTPHIWTDVLVIKSLLKRYDFPSSD